MSRECYCKGENKECIYCGGTGYIIECYCQGQNENCDYCRGTGYIKEPESLKRYKIAVIESKEVEKDPHQLRLDFNNKSTKEK